MAGFFVHVGARILCPHGGQVQIVPTNVRVKVSGMLVATLKDVYPIVGCPFVIGIKPSPCIRVQWIITSLRDRVMGSPVIQQASLGMCFSAESIPQGPPGIIQTQKRVKGL